MAEQAESADWEIGKLYEKVFEIVKKNKVLWIFGSAAAGAASFNTSNYSSSDFSSFEKLFPKDKAPEGSGQLTQVLGAASDPLGQFFSQLIANIPPYFYIILGVEILAIIAVFIFFGLLSSAWTQGSLISGTQLAIEGKNVSIRDSSEKTFPHLRSLIWLQIVPSLIVFGGAATIFAIIALGITLGPTPIKILFGILAGIGFIALIYFLIYLSLSQIWAPRKVIINGEKGKEALFSSYKIAKKKLWAMVLLGLVNAILGFLVMIVPVILIGVIAVLGFLNFRGSFNPVMILPLLPLIPIFLVGYMVLSGILTAFKATVWTLAYLQIKGKYDEK